MAALFSDGILVLFLFARIHAYVADMEPKCSKFDFEEKLLEKLIKVDHKTGLMMESLEDKLSKVQEELVMVKRELELKEKRSIYIRWGRTECSGIRTEMVYKGYTAGGQFSKGSGANLLCLPENPTWGNYDDSDNSHRGYIFGTEIDIRPQAASETIFGYQVNEHDLPCAVCQTQFSLTLMFPGRSTCFSGWSQQYAGYLVAGSHTHSNNKNYECLDGAPEAVPKGNTNDDQSILYLVEAKCGSLPCPPYVEGREIACVVCSR